MPGPTVAKPRINTGGAPKSHPAGSTPQLKDATVSPYPQTACGGTIENRGGAYGEAHAPYEQGTGTNPVDGKVGS